MSDLTGGGGDGAARAEGQYAAARTSVWWDIENCAVPRNCDPHLIALNISSALDNLGYRGRVSISAYGDTNGIPDAVQRALNSTGVSLNHIPAGVKDASDKKILVDMLFWAVDNPPPSNYLLISGDRDFSNALHQLGLRKYNVLLAQPQCASSVLVAAAKTVWEWPSLVAGGPPMSQLPEACKGKGKGNDNGNGNGSGSDSDNGRSANNRNGNSNGTAANNDNVKADNNRKKAKQAKNPDEPINGFSGTPMGAAFPADGPPMSQLPEACNGNSKGKGKGKGKDNGNGSGNGNGRSANNGNGNTNGRAANNDNVKADNNRKKAKQAKNPDINGFSGTPMGAAFPPDVLDIIGNVLSTLKNEKIPPTEYYIADCIHYRKMNFDVRIALNYALESQYLDEHKLGKRPPYYTKKKETLWECAQECKYEKHPKETWDSIQKFLSSAKGRSAMQSSKCRYQAAKRLKKGCLKTFVLGDILQILHVIINYKKWILPHATGWQPLSVTCRNTKSSDASRSL